MKFSQQTSKVYTEKSAMMEPERIAKDTTSIDDKDLARDGDVGVSVGHSDENEFPDDDSVEACYESDYEYHHDDCDDCEEEKSDPRDTSTESTVNLSSDSAVTTTFLGWMLTLPCFT